MSLSITTLRTRIADDESGFGMVELLMTLVVIAILLAIAVPSLLGFKDRATAAAAESNLRSAVPAVEAYYADHGTYVGMTTEALESRAGGIKVDVASANASTYCISSTEGGHTYFKDGPAGEITGITCT